MLLLVPPQLGDAVLSAFLAEADAAVVRVVGGPRAVSAAAAEQARRLAFGLSEATP